MGGSTSEVNYVPLTAVESENSEMPARYLTFPSCIPPVGNQDFGGSPHEQISGQLFFTILLRCLGDMASQDYYHCPKKHKLRSLRKELVQPTECRASMARSTGIQRGEVFCPLCNTSITTDNCTFHFGGPRNCFNASSFLSLFCSSSPPFFIPASHPHPPIKQLLSLHQNNQQEWW